MANEDGSVQVVFNGEIYNFRELRKDLIERGHHFRSRTDTETLVHLYEEFGVRCIERLRGMFAFAIWDERRRLALLARDRLGQKPLFYRVDDGRLLFGSEPKAILAFPGQIARADAEAIHHYLCFGFVPSPLSAFDGIRKLPPAHYLTFHDGKVNIQRYWRLTYTPKLQIGEQEASEEILRLLTEAIRLRMVSDVPLGAFLSGGVDSSAVVGIMAQLCGRVKTFSIGFREPDYDERVYARLIAQRFDTEHHEFVVESEHLTDTVEKLVWHYNEPYADPSALPTYYLSKLTRYYVTVALNGDAGDENFAGYRRYAVNLLASRLQYGPPGLRWMLGKLIAVGYRMMATDGPIGNRILELPNVLQVDWRLGYAHMLSKFQKERTHELCSPDFAALAKDSRPEELVSALFREAGTDDVIDSSLYVDSNLYLPDDLLVKVDIASMAVGLEARSPMVDHEFMEFAARLPSRYKMKGYSGKIIFKNAVRGLLPEEILGRTKKGFGVPLSHWFRGELGDFVSDVVLSSRAMQRGYFNRFFVEQIVREHAAGRRDQQYQLWTLLMLELWHRQFIDHKPAVQAGVI
jgi:asparagine synthase (glutamine-hydrolysing)